MQTPTRWKADAGAGGTEAPTAIIGRRASRRRCHRMTDNVSVSNPTCCGGHKDMEPEAGMYRPVVLTTIVYDDNRRATFLPVLSSGESPSNEVPSDYATDMRKVDQHAQGDFNDTPEMPSMDPMEGIPRTRRAVRREPDAERTTVGQSHL